MAEARCSSCGARIRWCRTANDKKIPLDAEPLASGGSVVIEGDLARVVTPGQGTHRSHFVTCAYAAKHRRPKGRG